MREDPARYFRHFAAERIAYIPYSKKEKAYVAQKYEEVSRLKKKMEKVKVITMDRPPLRSRKRRAVPRSTGTMTRKKMNLVKRNRAKTNKPSLILSRRI